MSVLLKPLTPGVSLNSSVCCALWTIQGPDVHVLLSDHKSDCALAGIHQGISSVSLLLSCNADSLNYKPPIKTPCLHGDLVKCPFLSTELKLRARSSLIPPDQCKQPGPKYHPDPIPTSFLCKKVWLSQAQLLHCMLPCSSSAVPQDPLFRESLHLHSDRALANCLSESTETA